MDPRPELRIGDRERAEVDARLRAAHADGVLTLVEYDERAARCYAARTRSDLAPLVADLPEPQNTTTTTTTAPAPTPDPPEHRAERVERQDRGRHPDRHGRTVRLRRVVPLVVVAAIALAVGPGVLGAAQGSAVFGSQVVPVAPGESRVEVGSLFGSVRVVVPDGERAATSGTMIFGSLNCHTACAVPPGPATAAPGVTVVGRGAFGSVDVVTASEAARHGDSDDDD